MSSANQLVAKIRTDLEPLERKIVGHPYLSTIEEGRVPRDLFNLFAGQQHHIIISDLRSIALIISRHGMFPGRRFLMNVLQGEAAALDGLHTFAGALGLSVIDLETFEPLPAAHAYCGFVAWLALYVL
jgi:thiaminase